jgi:hypothetical protein
MGSAAAVLRCRNEITVARLEQDLPVEQVRPDPAKRG